MTERQPCQENGVERGAEACRYTIQRDALSMSNALRQVEKEYIAVDPEVTDAGVTESRNDTKRDGESCDPIHGARQIQLLDALNHASILRTGLTGVKPGGADVAADQSTKIGQSLEKSQVTQHSGLRRIDEMVTFKRALVYLSGANPRYTRRR